MKHWFQIFLGLFLFSFNLAFSQQAKIDSLRKTLGTAPKDTIRIMALLDLANRADNIEAKRSAEEALELSEELKTRELTIRSIHTLANIYCNMGDYAEGLTYYLKELKILESTGEEKRRPGVYNGLGNVYMAQGQYPKALENFLIGLEIVKSFDRSRQNAIVTYYSNLGECYFLMKDYDRSLENYNKVLENNRARKDPDAYTMGDANAGIGNIYYLKNELEKALYHYKESLAKYTIIGMDQCMAGALNNIAKVFDAKKEYGKAIEYYTNSKTLSEKTKAKTVALIAYQGLAAVYSKEGDHKKANDALEHCIALKDSILNEKQLKMMGEMEGKYESAKKDKELITQKAEIQRQQADAEKKSMQRNIFIGGFALMALVVLLVLRSYRQKQKANTEISKQKEIIEGKQKEILDSIHYAKRIQKSLMSFEKYINKNIERLNQNKATDFTD